ncbi:transmembrane protein, putative (macronuclear) [Tetrahymena thermophila SB210]|uniref:Transmembrane protein, putative n=1 Tax=Tetrahymena thermophila (strain SB210) TaxID=312017 RepID=Q22P65_TETTS|nr:transmembrane protein, putative [Tetrahymena thermophila SB210]EAR86946.2 transmembrane protein, putative [Tetrahymena thermophila SB210]|eukprot:XP_001007191.2 transmembrane protein, putative [Tetrahymena thermophila SB210]
MIPDIIQSNQVLFNNNTVKDNECILYGQNIGSTLRKIELDQISNPQFIVERGDQQQVESIIVSNFRSGDYMFIDDIQILDEENKYFKYNPLLSYSQSVNEIIQQTTMTINIQAKSEKMNIFGGNIATFQKGKFSFNISLSYIPNQSSTLQIQSQIIPPLYNSKGILFLSQKQLSLNFKVDFRKCIIGEIQKDFFSSIICDQCPDGKYSLSLNDQSCQICPSTAVSCQGSIIQVKNGFWRKNNQTDQILYCQNAPNNCKPQNIESKFGCAIGYVGPLCEQCDFLGDVWGQRYSTIFYTFKCSKCSDTLILSGITQVIFLVVLTLYIYACNRKIINSVERELQNYYLKMMGLIYLNNSVYKANSTVYSKILIDHLQIISILSSIPFQFPTLIQISSNVGGNPLLIQTNMFDCFYPKSINIPKWFAKVMCSLSLPFIIYLLNYLINIFFKVVYKQNTHSRYQKTTMIFFYFYFYPSILFILIKSINCINIGNEKYAQIDTLIGCRNFSDHFIYNLLFSFPAIFVICIALPLFLIYKVRKNINQNLNKIQKSSYQFIYEPYKNQYYYWEFIRLFYKSAVMISSIILQDSLSLKTCIVNQILVLYNYFQMKVSPFTNKFHNQLETQSILISISTLNFGLVQSLLIDEFYIPIIIFQFFIIILNFNFIFKTLFLTFVRPIPAMRQNRNIIQQCLFSLKTQYPLLFTFIQIDYKIKFSTALKIKKLKSKLKNYIEIGNERLSVYQTQQRLQSLIPTQLKSPNSQFRISFFSQQNDNETINTEFENLKQANQPLTLHNKYQLSAKFKQQESSVGRQDIFDIQSPQKQNHFQFRLLNLKDQQNDESILKQNDKSIN